MNQFTSLSQMIGSVLKKYNLEAHGQLIGFPRMSPSQLNGIAYKFTSLIHLYADPFHSQSFVSDLLHNLSYCAYSG